MIAEQLRQRSDYTHKFNSKTGRHGWLRLTPAYSVKIVEELIEKNSGAKRIFDPFCGTGTTALSAAYHGHEGITTDINPFLIWLGQAKTAKYSSNDLERTLKSCKKVIGLVKKESVEPSIAPPIHNIERWWSSKALAFLCNLKASIINVTEERTVERNLLLISFCRILIELSNASFNHQSMSFKDDSQLKIDIEIDMEELFEEAVRFVIEGARHNPSGTGRVIFGDSRNSASVIDEKVDLVITSPPYANRMSYIRELRPYMYWLGFLINGRDAGELDWKAIGGTWGIATSRLADWERPNDHFKSNALGSVLDNISHADNKNGAVLSSYVAKYFDDMWSHFQGITPILSKGAAVHYIVGNSTFYGTLVSTELLYAEMMRELGFRNVECRPIRKRNSKKELIEFDVTAVWPK